jgi:carbon-monoxide dehydrogenase small subunit
MTDVVPHEAITTIELTVNGVATQVQVEPRTLLVDVLRDQHGLTGTHVGCEQGACGACTVLLDGEPTLSCLLLALQAEGSTVETVEGLAGDGGQHELNDLQSVFHGHHALQCGYCTPGMLMLATALRRRGSDATEADVREALIGNYCRCTGYEPIIDAVLEILQAESGRQHP